MSYASPKLHNAMWPGLVGKGTDEGQDKRWLGKIKDQPQFRDRHEYRLLVGEPVGDLALIGTT